MLLSRCCKEENGVAPLSCLSLHAPKLLLPFSLKLFYQKLAYFFARGSMSRRLVFVKSSLLPAGRTLHSAELCLSVHMLEVHSSPLIPALRIQKTIFYCVCSHQVCPISSLSNFKSLFSLTKGICNWFQVPTFWVMVLITLEKWSR